MTTPADIKVNVHDFDEVRQSLQVIKMLLVRARTLVDTAQNEMLGFSTVSSAVNYVEIANAATGNDPSVMAVGDDVTIDLVIGGKGGGGVELSNDVEVVGTLIASGGIQITAPDEIVSDTDGDINLTPNGNGRINLHGVKWPTNNPGPNENDVATIDASGDLLFKTLASAGIASTAHKDTHDPNDGSDALDTAAPSTNVTPEAGNSVGTSHTFARSDHMHNVPCGTAVSTTTANAEGTAPTFARSDHTHALHDHDHTGDAGDGGTLDASVIASGVLAAARGGSGTHRTLGRWAADALIIPTSTAPDRKSYMDRPVLVFDDAANEYATTPSFSLPGDYTNGTVKATIWYCVETATSNDVAFTVQVEAITPADAVDMLTASSFDTANAGTDTVPGTAKRLASFDITLSNKDSMAVGDLMRIRLNHDSANDTASDDSIVFAIEVWEDLS